MSAWGLHRSSPQYRLCMLGGGQVNRFCSHVLAQRGCKTPERLAGQRLYTQRPPSTSTAFPVRKLASSLAKKQQVLATSEGLVPRPRGTVDMKTFSFSGLPRKRSVLEGKVVSKALQSDGVCNLQTSTHTYDRADTAQTNVVFRVFDRQTLGGVDDGSF